MSFAKRIIIVNEDDDVKVSPETKGSLGVLPVEIIDASGNQIVDFGSTDTSATTPTIYNVLMSLADRDYSQSLPSGTKKVVIKLRDLGAELKVSFSSISDGATYITVSYGGNLFIEDVNLTGKSLYLQSSTALQTCEVICWT